MSENLYTLPQKWEWKKLGDTYIVKDGTHDSPKFVDEGYPFYTSKNLTENGLDNSNFKYISEDDYLKINLRSKVDKGDLLFAMIGTIGNPTIVNFEPSFAIKNMALFKKRNDNYLIEYLKYYLSSSFVIKKMLKEANGATQKFVGLGYLRNFDIPLPPFEEQRRIVGKLDGLFAKIDKSITLLDESIASASALMPSALNEVFGELEEKYESTNLESLCFKITDGSHKPPREVEISEYMMLSSKNIFNDSINFNNPRYLSKEDFDNENKRTDIQIDDVLLTIVGTIGRTAVVKTEKKFTLQRSVAVLKPIKDKTDSRFLMYFLQSSSDKLSDNAQGSVQKRVYLKSVRTFNIPSVPIDIQTQTIAYLDALHVKVEALKKAQMSKKEELLALKASLLESAFKGEF